MPNSIPDTVLSRPDRRELSRVHHAVRAAECGARKRPDNTGEVLGLASQKAQCSTRVDSSAVKHVLLIGIVIHAG